MGSGVRADEEGRNGSSIIREQKANYLLPEKNSSECSRKRSRID